MTHGRLCFILTLGMLAGLYTACSRQKEASTDTGQKTDSQLIQEALQTAVERWRYGDKAALYDMEFEYYQELYTYDDYLQEKDIMRLEADSLESLVVYRVQLWDRDSAHVRAEAVFVGPSGKKTRFDEGIPYRMYFHRGRWIHPTLSTIDEQLAYEEALRQAEGSDGEED